MATYLLINCLFVIVTFVLFRIKLVKPSRRWWIVLIALLVLTAVFDSMLVYFEFIDYAPDKILGLSIGYAPIEDFFYAAYAAILVPFIWNKIGDKRV